MKMNKKPTQETITKEIKTLIRSIIDLENQMSDIWKQYSIQQPSGLQDFALEGMLERIKSNKIRLGETIVFAVRHGVLEISLDDLRQEVYKGYQKDESGYIAAES